MFNVLLFFIFDSPTQILFVVAIVFLLFGSTKLPQLAKSLGQSRKAFKDGMREAEEDDWRDEAAANRPLTDSFSSAAPQISAMSDEELLAEMQRRAQTKEIK